ARRGRRKRGRGARRPAGPRPEVWSTRRAHLVSYVGLFLFTAFVFFRPYEHLPLPGLAYGAQVLAIFTLAAYFPAQLSAEGNLAARPREVNLALLLLLAALLSVPLAVSPAEAWANFVEFGKVVLMFVVLVNVVRTERRLHWLILLSLAASVFMSAAAINDYAAGRLGRGGRVKGAIGGLFENPNDLALHLVTMIPLAVCLMFGRRGPLKKLAYGLAAALFVAATVVTFSRGGFLGLLAASAVLGWKLGRKNRPAVFALGVLAVAAFVIAVPNEYGSRLSSIFGGDATGSATARQAVLWRSVVVALRYPIFGVGIGNFHFKSLREQVAHNSYTQVASEMGLAALVVYCLFIIAPLVRLRAVERETLGVKELARYYYLSVGLQASLAGYMVSSFFASVAHLWYVYHLVGYAVCLRRLYAVGGGRAASPGGAQPALTDGPEGAAARPGPRAAGAGET
ncbi:MAG TPA: O-antigen ligase family protein, partial [Pyrinomonadaceae bacterium]|nr:O-antigen ligase family protein [Pyrinomonadaceae bacterium]